MLSTSCHVISDLRHPRSIHDHVVNRRRDEHDLRGDRAARTVRARQEALRDHRGQRFREPNADHVLLLGRKQRHDPHDGALGVGRVQRG